MTDNLNPVLRLQIFRVSQTMTEGKTIGGVLRGIVDGDLSNHAKAAKQWVQDAIEAVKSSRGADPSWTDEQIAMMIIDEIKKKNPKLRV